MGGKYISEGRQRAKEMRKSCEETFVLLNGIWLGSDGGSSIETLDQINKANIC